MSIGGLGMKGSIALAAVPALAVLAVLTASVAPGGGGTAYAEEPVPSADLRMVYGSPEVAVGDRGVTWHWTLTNAGRASAQAVVATHKISPSQKILGVSQPCAGAGGDVVCRFAELKPGERRAGWIRTSVVTPGGSLHVNAQVTWHENPSAGAPPAVDAGHALYAVDPADPGASLEAPRTESWGMADTGVSFTPQPDDMPGQGG